MIFETIKNVFDKKNSQDATEGKDVEELMNAMKITILHMM